MVYIFHNQKTGEKEKVEKCRYSWEARYDTGEVVAQYAPDETYHQTREIDPEHCKIFSVNDSVYSHTVSMLVSGTVPTCRIITTVLAKGTDQEKKIIDCLFGHDQTWIAMRHDGKIEALSSPDDFRTL